MIHILIIAIMLLGIIAFTLIVIAMKLDLIYDQIKNIYEMIYRRGLE